MILSFIDNLTTGTQGLVLLIWNVAQVVYLDGLSATGGIAFGVPAILGVIDISDIMQSFDHDKSSYVSQLINGKSRDLQKLLKYFTGLTTSVSNKLFLFGVLPINFVLYLKDLLVFVFYHYVLTNYRLA